MSFEIGLSTSKAREEITGLNARIQVLARTADLAALKLQNAVSGVGGAAQFKDINTGLNGINNKLTAMSSQWQKTYSAATKSANGLHSSVNKGSNGMISGAKAAGEYGDSLLSVSQKAAILRSSMLAMGTHVGIFTASTLIAATVAYGTVKAIRGIIEVGADYTQSLAAISAVTGQTRDGLQGLSMDMLDLAEKTKFTTTEVGQAAVILGKTGMKTVEISQALGPVLNLASIGTMSMAKAADIAANSMFGFQKKTSDLTEIVDILAFTATNSNSTVEQLGNSMSYAAAIASAAGAKFEEVAAMLGVMHNAGVKGSKAGTTLRRAYLNLLDPSDKVISIMKDLNVSLTDSEGNLRSLIDIMRDFAKAGGNAVDIKDMFGIRAVPGMIALWKDLSRGIVGGMSTIEDFANRSDEIAGSSERMREAAEKNLIDIWKKFKSVVSVQATAAFLEIEEGLSTSIESMTEFFRATVDAQKVIQVGSVYLKDWADLFTEASVGIRSVSNELSGQIAAWKEVGGVLGSTVIAGLRDLPTNMIAVAKIAGVMVGSIIASIDELGIKWSIFSENFKHIFLKACIGISSGFYSVLDPVFGWMSDKLLATSDAIRGLPMMGGTVKLLEDAGIAIDNMRGGIISDETAEMESQRHKEVIGGLTAELKEKEALRKKIGVDMVSAILDERDARLKARDATVAQTKANIEWDREAERIFAEMDRFNLPEDDAVVGTGRKKPDGPKTDILKSSAKDLTNFIKLQKQSIDSANSQISHLEKLGKISPFESLSAGVQKGKNSLDAIKEKFEALIIPLRRWEKEFTDAGYVDSEAKKYTAAIKKITDDYSLQTASIIKDTQAQADALEILRSKYEVVADAQAGFMVKPVKGVGNTEDAIDFMEALRSDSMSEADKIQKSADEKLAKLAEVRDMEAALIKDGQMQSLISEQEYLNQKTLITENALRAKYALTAEYYKKEALLEESLHVAKTKSAVGGIAAYTEAGARSSKKLFEINKKARIAMILSDTPAAISGAYTHGAELGGPILGAAFAALAFTNQAAMLQQASSVTFGGGSSASPPPSATPSVTAQDIAPQSDAIFNQTNTGGTKNTVDSTPVGDLNVNFSITAVDAQGIDQLLAQRKPQIVGMIQSAYTERGKRGGPLL